VFSVLLDEDYMHAGLLRALRAAGLDVLSVADAGRRGLSDEEQLTFAALDGRVLYSCNQADFARLHVRWMASGRHHSGIVLSSQRFPVGVQLRALLRLAETSDAMGAMTDHLEFLSDWIQP